MTTVLVVEDEVLIARDIQRTLLRLGYDVPVTAGTGERALEATLTTRPSLVLMDIRLRGAMDGIEAAAAIQVQFDVPIVYLTSHSDEDTLSRAKTTNPHGYLLKPFSDRELRTAIEVALHRHGLEARLATRERWFSTTLRSIADGVIATDSSETITFMNAVAETLTGWGQEALQRPLAEVLRVVDRVGAPLPSPGQLALSRSAAAPLSAEAELVVKDGHRVAVDVHASPIVDDKQALLGAVVVVRDLTERRRLQARLVQTERLASLGTMAAGIAHEINNPLTYVILNIDESLAGLKRAIADLGVASVDGPDDRALRERVVAELAGLEVALREAGGGADRVRLVVQGLQQLTWHQERDGRSVDLSAVLEAAIKMTAHTVRHHARVRRDFGATPLVYGTESAIGQVCTNLLVNAAQAIGDGHADANEIRLTTYTDAAGNAVLEVRDTGPGIAPSVMPHLFDPFYTTKAVGAGTGLGLAICHTIVTDLGGSLVAENPVGGGALFRLTLPAAAATAATAAPRAEVAPSRRGRVLVIDDEPTVALALARTIRGMHDVTVHVDGREALASIASGAFFDVIFCDLMMPNLSGIEVYRAVASLSAEQAGRIVFVTGGTFASRTDEFLEAAANRTVAKPFSAETIRSIVREYVNGPPS